MFSELLRHFLINDRFDNNESNADHATPADQSEPIHFKSMRLNHAGCNLPNQQDEKPYNYIYQSIGAHPIQPCCAISRQQQQLTKDLKASPQTPPCTSVKDDEATGYTNRNESETVSTVSTKKRGFQNDFSDRVVDAESQENEEFIPNQQIHRDKYLSFLPLAVIVFYNVSGGPFGIEPTVRAGGALFAIIGYFVFPFLWSIPEALVTAELGSAYPEASGGVAWVEEAFGSKAGLIAGYLKYVSGSTDNAIYPVLFLEYLAQIFTKDEDEGWNSMNLGLRFMFVVGISLILSLINYLGLEIVGKVSMVIALVSMSPFIIMCVMGIPKIDPSRWLEVPYAGSSSSDGLFEGPGLFPVVAVGGVMWRTYLNNLFWNLNAFDAGASFSGEVKDVGKTYPKAIFYSVFFVAMGYFLPLVVGIGATDSKQEDWVDGYFTTICTKIGGEWLGAWTVFAAGISNLAMFEAEMSTDSFQVLGMANRGLLPAVFAKKSRFGTPTYAIMLEFLIILCMSMADFSSLVEMLNFTYAISILMEYAAFIKLRITKNDVERPYRIPLGTTGCKVLVTIPSLMIVLLLLMASYKTCIYFVVFSFLGVLLYHLQKVAKNGRWCDFVEKNEGEFQLTDSSEELFEIVEIERDRELT